MFSPLHERGAEGQGRYMVLSKQCSHRCMRGKRRVKAGTWYCPDYVFSPMHERGAEGQGRWMLDVFPSRRFPVMQDDSPSSKTFPCQDTSKRPFPRHDVSPSRRFPVKQDVSPSQRFPITTIPVKQDVCPSRPVHGIVQTECSHQCMRGERK